MPKPDWYTGSDTTGKVAAGIEATIERMDAHIADHSDIETISSLLKLEDEVNWRAFLQGLGGTIHYDLDEIVSAKRIFELSIEAYKVYLDTFDEVLSVFCQSCYTMGTILFDEKDYALAIPYFLRCLPYMHEVYEEPYLGNIYTFLEVCYSWLSENQNSLVFSEAAAFSRRCDCASLERLMMAYTSVGEVAKATEVYQLLGSRCQDYEDFDRVLDFAQRNLGETGVVN